MNFKKLFLTIALVLSSTAIIANDTVLVLEFKNALKVMFALPDKPELTFEPGILNIESEKVSVKYDFNDINKYYFTSLPTGIDNVETNQNTLNFVFTDDNNIKVYGIDNSKEVIVCDVLGKRVNVEIHENINMLNINVANLTKGVYIISVGKHSIKIFK